MLIAKKVEKLQYLKEYKYRNQSSGVIGLKKTIEELLDRNWFYAYLKNF